MKIYQNKLKGMSPDMELHVPLHYELIFCLQNDFPKSLIYKLELFFSLEGKISTLESENQLLRNRPAVVYQPSVTSESIQPPVIKVT